MQERPRRLVGAASFLGDQHFGSAWMCVPDALSCFVGGRIRRPQNPPAPRTDASRYRGFSGVCACDFELLTCGGVLFFEGSTHAVHRVNQEGLQVFLRRRIAETAEHLEHVRQARIRGRARHTAWCQRVRHVGYEHVGSVRPSSHSRVRVHRARYALVHSVDEGARSSVACELARLDAAPEDCVCVNLRASRIQRAFRRRGSRRRRGVGDLLGHRFPSAFGRAPKNERVIDAQCTISPPFLLPRRMIRVGLVVVFSRGVLQLFETPPPQRAPQLEDARVVKQTMDVSPCALRFDEGMLTLTLTLT